MNCWQLSQIARWSGGRLEGDDVKVTGICTDSRKADSGSLFIALEGDRFDGHDFIDRDLPASALMVSRPVQDDRPRIVVDNTVEALGRLATAWRATLPTYVIGLTGSNGKTTVKEMLASIFACEGRTQYTQGNLNNHIGVPLTLLTIEPGHQFAIIEMGANHAGEIAVLTRMVQPQVALVNNAGPAHLEGFGDLPGVARAKAEIYSGLSDDGIAVVNADDDFSQDWIAINAGRKIIRFGMNHPAEIQGEYHGGDLKVTTPQGHFEVQLALPGSHNAMNALAATAVALGAGIRIETVRQGLAAVKSVSGRLRQIRGDAGFTVLDDTYNANPASFRAGLEVLMEEPGAHWVVLGDMAELGDNGPDLHRSAGEQARNKGVDRLFTLGKLSHEATRAFGQGALHSPDFDALAGAVKRTAEVTARPLTILVKGSRTMGLERLVRQLLPTPDVKGKGRRHVV